MKENDITKWRCPMNQAEENDLMIIVRLYNPSRALVKHINENNRESIELLENMKFVKHNN